MWHAAGVPLRESVLRQPPKSPEGGQWYVAARPMKVERGGALVDLQPGDAIPEIWESSDRRRKLEEARGLIKWRPNPAPPISLVRALVDALSATKTGAAKAEAILGEHGLSSAEDLALPSVDPEIRSWWAAKVEQSQRRAAAAERRAKIVVTPTDRIAFEALQRTKRYALVEVVAQMEPEKVREYSEALGLPGEPGEWPHQGLVDAVALSTGCGAVEYAPDP